MEGYSQRKRALKFYTAFVIFYFIFRIPMEIFHSSPILNLSLTNSLSISYILVPRPVNNKLKCNQYFLTFSSLLLQSQTSEIIILLSKEEFDPKNIFLPIIYQHFESNRIRFVDKLESDEDHVPYIDSWFIEGFDAAKGNLVCWINSDIILPEGWMDTIMIILDSFKSKRISVAAISQRIDGDYDLENIEYKLPIDYFALAKNKTEYTIYGVDFYLVSRTNLAFNIDDVPPFHMGRYFWDPWVTYYFNMNMPTVHLGDFKVLHINHQSNPFDTKEPKASENFDLRSASGEYKMQGDRVRYMLKKTELGLKVVENEPVVTEKIKKKKHQKNPK